VFQFRNHAFCKVAVESFFLCSHAFFHIGFSVTSFFHCPFKLHFMFFAIRFFTVYSSFLTYGCQWHFFPPAFARFLLKTQTRVSKTPALFTRLSQILGHGFNTFSKYFRVHDQDQRKRIQAVWPLMKPAKML